MGLRILHISDVHLGVNKEKKSTHFIHSNTTPEIPNPKYLSELITKYYPNGSVDMIIDSGDLVWGGNKSEYFYSKQFWDILKNHFPNVPIIVIPGNHDVDFSVAIQDRQSDFISFTQDFYSNNFSEYYPFFNNGDRHSLVNFQALPQSKLLVVGVNSAANIDNYDSDIFIDDRILAKIADKINADKLSDFLKIFVIHHHLFPFVEQDFGAGFNPDTQSEQMDKTIVSNSARIQNWLSENKFHLVLHGHRHQLHGRVDKLWHYKTKNVSERKIIILGAGSAGIYSKESPETFAHSFNEIMFQETAKNEYKISIVTNEIESTGSSPKYRISPKADSKRVIYTANERKHNFFESEFMDDCHSQISDEVIKNERIYNFMSIVHNPTYCFPENSCKIGNRLATQDEIIRSFQSLHPEYLKSKKWTDEKGIKKSVRQRENNYSINHGSRIFGGNHLLEVPDSSNISDYFPINKVVKKLYEEDGDSKGYISLFNYDIDVKYRSAALPGLMGIQIVRKKLNGNTILDIVALFRTIELSFWWVVNMYEMIQILEYSLKKYRELNNNVEKGSITFFATMAKWKEKNLNLTIEPLIETKKTEDLFLLISKIEKNDPNGIRELKDLLEDFHHSLSEINISFNNLEQFRLMANGVYNKSDIIKSIATKLEAVCVLLDNCIEKKDINDVILDSPKVLLRELVDELTQAIADN